VAYTSEHNGNWELFVLDTTDPTSSPINISQSQLTGDHALDWSPDGKYLAYVAYDANDSSEYKANHIYVWDGKTRTDITPADLGTVPDLYVAAWSKDNKLAFTAQWLSVSPPDDPSEIYLWDGAKIVNLSQNPTGWDHNPAWSTDGRIAFQSVRNDNYEIYVWDGVSVKNGQPDAETFLNVATKFTSPHSSPTWTNKDQLAFQGTGPRYTHYQIYLWDGKTALNLTDTPMVHNQGESWSYDGRWTYTNFYSSEQFVYVRDEKNRLLLKTEGEYPPAWSSDGYLVFCRRAPRGWYLMLWDGKQLFEIAQGQNIWAQWASGAYTNCSSG
jgi:Tol biopolymer transport system component